MTVRNIVHSPDRLIELKQNKTSDWKRKIEIKLFIQSDFASGRRLMGIIRIRLMIYFLECRVGLLETPPRWHATIAFFLVKVFYRSDLAC